MNILTRPILEINLTNVLKNYNMLAQIADKAIPAAVVKDDAYGIGAEKVSQMLYEQANCRCFSNEWPGSSNQFRQWKIHSFFSFVIATPF